MPFPSGSLGIVPWMNGRTPNDLTWPTTATFNPNTNVVFKWIEDGTYTNPSIRIYAHGKWGSQNISHTVIAVAITSNPVSVDHTVATRALLFAITPTTGQTALVTSDNSYWIAQGGFWVRTVVEAAAGTVSAFGVTADIKTITVPMADIPAINGQGLIPGEYYTLCWEENSLHFAAGEGYDAVFNVRPLIPYQGGLVDRCELCGIRLRIPRQQFYQRNGKPKCIMQ